MDSRRLDKIISELRDEIDDKKYYVDEQIARIKEQEKLIDDNEIIIMKLEELK